MGAFTKPPVKPTSKPPVKPAATSVTRPAPKPIENRTYMNTKPSPEAVAPKRRGPDLDALFDGMDKVVVKGDRRPFLMGGHYLLECIEASAGTSRKSVPYVALDFKVLANINSRPDGTFAHSVGEEVRHYCSASMESFKETIKKFIATAMDCDPASVDASDSKMLVGPDQPTRGRILEVFVREEPMTKKEGVFTNVHYRRLVSAEEAAVLIGQAPEQPAEEPEGFDATAPEQSEEQADGE